MASFTGYEDELDRIAGFAARAREELIDASPPTIDPEHIARIAAVAREASSPRTDKRGWHRGRLTLPVGGPRLARLAATAAAVAIGAPLSLGGLAVAGASLPDPVASAFETFGISLPNQASTAANDEARQGTEGAEALAAECADRLEAEGDELGSCIAERASSFGDCVSASAAAGVSSPARVCAELRPDSRRNPAANRDGDTDDGGGAKPERTPGAPPASVPGGQPAETPDGKPDGAPGAKPEGTPSAPLGGGSGGKPEGTPGASPDGVGGPGVDTPSGGAGGTIGGKPEGTPGDPFGTVPGETPPSSGSGTDPSGHRPGAAKSFFDQNDQDQPTTGRNR